MSRAKRRMKIHIKCISLIIFFFLLSKLCLCQNSLSAQKLKETIYLYESVNDSIDISNNFYDLSDSLFYIFRDTLIYSPWTTNRVYTQSENWEGLSDSIALPLLINNNQNYIHPINKHVTSNFGRRRNGYHYGVDLNLDDGDTVVVAFDGIIRFANYHSGYGNVVVVRHFNGLETLYAHFNKILIDTGKFVESGDPVGLGGRTGRTFGSHLHFETRFKGVALNPNDIIDFENYKLKADTLILLQKKFSPDANNSKVSGSNGTVITGISSYHTIRRGETLSRIAAKYDTTIDNLCRLNGIRRNNVIRAGEKIRIR